jgi:hypothetical protein
MAIDFTDPAVLETARLYYGNPWYMAASMQRRYPGITGEQICWAIEAADITPEVLHAAAVQANEILRNLGVPR